MPKVILYKNMVGRFGRDVMSFSRFMTSLELCHSETQPLPAVARFTRLRTNRLYTIFGPTIWLRHRNER